MWEYDSDGYAREEFIKGNYFYIMEDGKKRLVMIESRYSWSRFCSCKIIPTGGMRVDLHFMSFIRLSTNIDRLVKLGFEFDGERYEYQGCKVFQENGKWMAFIDGGLIEVPYIHILQNFFRDKTGQELTININP